MIKIPFAKYQDMKDCISKNKDKKNPAGYCATIMRKVEGEKMSWKKLSFLVPIQESAQNNDDFLIKGIAINEESSGFKWIKKEEMALPLKKQKRRNGLMQNAKKNC